MVGQYQRESLCSMQITLFIIIILIASILQTSTGFGFSILATPFLLLLFEPAYAIQINLILSFIISLALITTIQKDIRFDIIKRLLIGSLIGLPIGIVIFLQINSMLLKVSIGIIILTLTILLIFHYRMKQSKRKDTVVGALSGALTTSIGMPGPPLLLYFTGTKMDKETLRGTTLAFYLFIYIISLLIQVVFAGTNPIVWKSSLYALPLVFIGLFIGQKLFLRLNQRTFQIFTYILLAFTGIYLLIESFG